MAKIGIPNFGKILEKLFYEIQTLIIQTPYRKLEVEGFLLGKKVFEMKENGWGKGLGTFWKSIFERSEGMDGIWVDDFGNPLFQK